MKKRLEFIPYGRQHIDDDDIAAVVDTLRSDFLTQGPKIIEFENAIAKRVGARYCVAFSSATAALHAAAVVAGLDKGDEGITSPNTFVASANAIAYAGARPVFADIDAKTYCISPKEIERAITKKTKALIPVDYAGNPADMEAIADIAKKQNIKIIEDAAHAIGSLYSDGSPVGCCAYSDMTVFSFHPVKTITTGEGGAITTNTKTMYEKLLLFRSHGITKNPALFHSNPGPWYYEMQCLGYNYRMTDIQAALGISQLKKLEKNKTRRREIVAMYNEAFGKNENIVIPYEAPDVSSCFHLYVVKINFGKIGKSRSILMEELKNDGIGTQVHYIPVHLQPFYRKTFLYKKGDFPIAEEFYSRALSLPLYSAMDADDVKRVITAVEKAVP